MTTNNTDVDANLALFCDFENVALGVRDEKYPKFDIALVLERLLVKGSIVAKKAYCDWDRYKDFKAVMHDAAFELIEIPHTRQSSSPYSLTQPTTLLPVSRSFHLISFYSPLSFPPCLADWSWGQPPGPCQALPRK